MKALVLILFLAGCTVYNACRPMQTGLVWSEWERFNADMFANTLYAKQCIYTSVAINGDWAYDCVYNEVTP